VGQDLFKHSAPPKKTMSTRMILLLELSPSEVFRVQPAKYVLLNLAFRICDLAVFSRAATPASKSLAASKRSPASFSNAARSLSLTLRCWGKVTADPSTLSKGVPPLHCNLQETVEAKQRVRSAIDNWEKSKRSQRLKMSPSSCRVQRDKNVSAVLSSAKSSRTSKIVHECLTALQHRARHL